METDFLEAMPVQFIVEKYIGRDVYGNPRFDPPRRYQGRWEGISRDRGRGGTAHETHGTEIEKTSRIICDHYGISPYDRLTLPGNVVPTVISVITEYDENGPHHQVIDLAENRS